MEDSHNNPELPPPDSHFLKAAYGWMELGNPDDALLELDRISPDRQEHPDSLLARFRVFSRARRLDGCLQVSSSLIEVASDWSEAWLAYCSALHWLGKTQNAYDVIRPQLEKFPNNWMILYDLACYACQLGNMDESIQWLEKAYQYGNRKQIRLMASTDPDLKPLQDI